MNIEDLEQRLAKLIAGRESQSKDIKIDKLHPISGGNAREAYSFDVNWSSRQKGNRRECILLLQAKKGQLDQGLLPEFSVLRLLVDHNIPSPSPYWLDIDGHFLGAPGLIMERLPGRADLRDLLDSKHKIRNSRLAAQMATAAARLHNIDWNNSNFESSTTVTEENIALRQVQVWEALFLKHRMEPLPALSNAFDWLRQNCPRAESIVIVHGDLRFGNILYNENNLSAVLDWEMTHLGDACEDIAWAYRALWSPEPQLLLSEFIDHYLKTRKTKVNSENLLFYRLFGEVKHAIISLTGASNFSKGDNRNLRLADRMTWTTECLRQFYNWLPDNKGRGHD